MGGSQPDAGFGGRSGQFNITGRKALRR
jgi:hypothetical protein